MVHLLFDLLAWAAAIATGIAVWQWRLKQTDTHAPVRRSTGYLLALVAGAIIGAFVVGTANMQLSGHDGVGRSIIGALAGAIVAVEGYKAATGIRGSTGVYFAAPLAVGVVIGRIGCYLAGLDDFTHGSPTTLPWGVDFGDGVVRHPVQLYEALALAAFLFAYLLALRKNWQPVMASGFYLVVAWYGAQRFIWEFMKPYALVAGPFNLFHVLSAALVAYGLWMIFFRQRQIGS